MNPRDRIARRVARIFEDNDVVNLGIGLPTSVANHVPEDVHIVLQSENGFIRVGPVPEPGREDPDVVDAGGNPVSILPGGCCFDSATSFAIIRGGHLAATVLGALEVDQEGNLANWMIPGKKVPGMSGAIVLVAGARKVIIAMEHVTKSGDPKILKKCRLPLTAAREADLIVTELGFMEVTDEGIVLKELAPGVTVGEIQSKTEAVLIIPDQIGVMNS